MLAMSANHSPRLPFRDDYVLRYTSLDQRVGIMGLYRLLIMQDNRNRL
jgi:hypothetical protein